MEKSKAPRELAIEKSHHKFYEDLKAGRILPELKGYDMANIFVIAMAYGVYYDEQKPIKNPQRSITTTAVQKDFEWLIKAIAISKSKEGLDIVTNEGKIYQLAEEYANGGIEMIEKVLKGSKPGEFKIAMEKLLNKIQKK